MASVLVSISYKAFFAEKVKFFIILHCSILLQFSRIPSVENKGEEHSKKEYTHAHWENHILTTKHQRRRIAVFFIGIVGGGVQLGPLDTAATNGLLCQHRVIMMMEKLVE
jgi:hypothetical protein